MLGEPEGDRLLLVATNSCLPLVMVAVAVAVVAMVVPARGDSAANEVCKGVLLVFAFVSEFKEAAAFPDKTSGDICKLRYRTLLAIFVSMRKY